MSSAEPETSSPNALRELLLAWISTDTWNESLEQLKLHADELLNEHALQELDTLLAGTTDEERRETLQQHRKLLEVARAESPDAAYAELLKPLPLTRAIQTLPVELRDAVQAVVTVRNSAELREQVEKHPILLTSEALTVIETIISDLLKAGQENAAKHVSERYDGLKQIINARNNPLNQAFNALLNATPTTLHKVIAQHPLLLDEETQQAFANAAMQREQGGDAATARKIRLLLTEVQRSHPQDARQASPPIGVSQRKPHHSDGPTTIGARGGSVAAGEIRDSVVTTHTYHSGGDRLPEKRWLCPPLEDFGDKPFIGREEELATLLTHLKAGEHVAITGAAAALQGMAGIGKTFLARKLAMELRPSFPASVIFLTLGEQVVDEPSAQALLRQLANCTFGGLAPAGHLYPGTVAAWLKEMAPGRLLVIFDDVWSREALRVLSRALPDETIRLITTRFADIGRQIQGEPYVLDRLTDEDGLALLEGRLDCRGDLAYRPFLQNLVKLLDGHALALEIAAARMKPSKNARPTAQDPLFAARKLNRVQTVCDSLQKGIGRGNLDGLKLGRGQERDDNVEKSLGLSYESMTPEQQRRFRAFGVFSAETPITVQAAAAIWRQEEYDAARDEMAELVDLALLTEVEGLTATSYRQHGLLQVYAHALLEKASELTSTSWAHAQYYTDLVWRIEAATPQDYSLLDLHMQNLLMALQWTRRQEPVLFSRLIDGLEQFLRIRGQIALLEEYLPEAEKIASSTGNRGRQANVRWSLGDLESRLGNLEEARAHYDAALPLFKQVSNRLGEANVYMSHGDMHLAQKAWSEASNAYEQALPLFVAMRDPLGEANTLIDLGLARFELGDHEQGMLDVQRAAALFLFTRSPEWVQRAERRLAEMRARLEQPEVRELLAFAAADWTRRRQLLTEHASFLLSEQVEPAFDALIHAMADANAVGVLEGVRTLLRRCRTWGVDTVFYFALQMRLGDAIALPAQDEPAVMQVATLLARQGEDAAALEQAVEIMETLLNRLTAATPPLFEAALLRDLAQALLALPTGHPLRRLDQIEAYYREALPLYAAAERAIGVAFLQRALGELLSGQGRYEEALPCLQAAIEGLQTDERYTSEVAWTLSSYAYALDKLGHIAEALVAYDQAIALLPETPQLLRNRAETLIYAHRWEEAEADLAQAVALDGHEERSYLWFRRAQLAIARGDGSLATTLLDEVLKRNPSYDVRFLRAQSAWLCGDHSAAQAELQRAFSGASAGAQATMRRELQLMHDEHPDLSDLAVEA